MPSLSQFVKLLGQNYQILTNFFLATALFGVFLLDSCHDDVGLGLYFSFIIILPVQICKCNTVACGKHYH